jgi:hypothetical protein
VPILFPARAFAPNLIRIIPPVFIFSDFFEACLLFSTILRRGVKRGIARFVQITNRARLRSHASVHAPP